MQNRQHKQVRQKCHEVPLIEKFVRVCCFLVLPIVPSLPDLPGWAEPGQKPPVDLFEHFEKTPSAQIEHVARGVYQIGNVRVDQVTGTVRFPARVNAVTWADVEYLVVAEKGKDHESVFVAQAEPLHINLALIMLGLTGGEPLARQGDHRPPKGSPVRVSVEWVEDEAKPVKKIPAEDFIWDRVLNRTMPRTHWIYTGSRFDGEGRYMAQLSRSVIAVYHDPDALVDTPLEGGGRPHQYSSLEKPIVPDAASVSVVIERIPVEPKKDRKGGKKR